MRGTDLRLRFDSNTNLSRKFLRAFLISAISAGAAMAQEDLLVKEADLPRREALTPESALESFELEPGFSIELVAHEPQVTDPVAIAFDEKGGLYAVEMRGYSERMDALLGRVKYLQDLDHDGFFETSTIFAENLAWPTAITCSQGGVIVIGVPDMVFLKDLNGDHQADLTQVLYSGFGSKANRLNVQQLPNNLTWGPDHRFHGAGGGNASWLQPRFEPADAFGLNRRDFTLNPLDWSLTPTSGGAQHGMTLDNFGRKFVCSNSHHIQTVLFESDWYAGPSSIRVPNPLMDIAAEGPAATVYRSSPDEPWRVIRTEWRVAGKVPGPIEGGGTPSGYFTAATGIVIYRGTQFPDSHQGNAFIADAGSNLVHRKIVGPAQDQINWIASRALPERKSEFLRSSDNWFRPVQLENGPDGALYVLDMYREVIEHPWSLPEPLKSKIDLNSGMDRGRIYRIVANDRNRILPAPNPGLASDQPAQWVDQLRAETGWIRDTASRLLYEKQDRSILPLVEKLVLDPSSSSETVVQALGVWKGLGGKNPGIYRAALKNPSANVREVALQWLPEWASGIYRNSDTHSESSGWILEALHDAMQEKESARVRWMAWNAYGQLRSNNILQPDSNWVQNAIDSVIEEENPNWIHIAAGRALAMDPIPALEKISHKTNSEKEDQITAWWRDWADILEKQNPLQLFNLCKSLAESQSVSDSVQWLALEKLAGLRAHSEFSRQPEMMSAIQKTIQANQKLAESRAMDSEEAEKSRLRAIQYLRQFPITQDSTWLQQGLLARQPESIRSLVADIIDESSSPLGEIYLQSWNELTPQLRQRAVNYWLSQPARLRPMLAGWTAAGLTWKDLPRDFRAALETRSESWVRDWVHQLKPADAVQATQSSDLNAWNAALTLQGSVSAGKQHFEERCASCHRLRGDGKAVGPDLEAALAMGRLAFLNAVLNPSQEIDSRYTLYELTLKNGQTAQGLIQQESGDNLTLKFPYAITQDFSRNEIQSLKALPHSLMPENLEEDWSHQDMADLLGFIFQAN